MNVSVEQFLNSFDALSEREQHEAVALLLQRVFRDAAPEIPEEALVAAADELFLELDAREAADGQP